AKVYLIKLITGGTLEAVDSTTTDAQGYYSFNNKPIDDYRIKVALNTSSLNYNSNIPTYYANALMWYDAQIVTLFGNTYNRDIYMLYGTNPGGNGFISGNVFQGANKPSRNVVDVTLILVDQSNQLPVAYAKTDANGNYSFSNIPNGTYKVYGELLNRASIPENLVISSSQSSYSNKNFVYNDNVIQPTNTSVSVPTVTLTSNLRISPNPATTNIRLENSAAASSIKIRDLTGRIIKSFEVQQGEPIYLDCQSWRKGIYLIEEVTRGVKITHKLNIQ
ncbi:MAG TPA: T9SS type A sorting domain-containing protein, partial [Chitinophagaceae bacterium]|nr:T9SS type A sorting domain-containing protein [Chitinophagaceae bacterium]